MTVEKKDIDWGSLGFGYMKTAITATRLIGRTASGTRAA